MKIWLETVNQNLDEDDVVFEFSTYLVTALVIFLFQYKGLLPPLIKMGIENENGIEGDQKLDKFYFYNLISLPISRYQSRCRLFDRRECQYLRRRARLKFLFFLWTLFSF